MPFIVRCPQANCQKYMLVEDEMRGTKVKCLLCGQMLQIEQAPSRSDQRSLAASAGDKTTRTCPTCQTKMRVPVAARQVRCPKCQSVN